MTNPDSIDDRTQAKRLSEPAVATLPAHLHDLYGAIKNLDPVERELLFRRSEHEGLGAVTTATHEARVAELEARIEDWRKTDAINFERTKAALEKLDQKKKAGRMKDPKRQRLLAVACAARELGFTEDEACEHYNAVAKQLGLPPCSEGRNLQRSIDREKQKAAPHSILTPEGQFKRAVAFEKSQLEKLLKKVS